MFSHILIAQVEIIRKCKTKNIIAMPYYLDAFIENAISEDIGDMDITSFACIPDTATGKARLLVKDNGVIAGVEIARRIFKIFDRATSA